jgi:nucleotide-binding universal stress UspA family protein
MYKRILVPTDGTERAAAALATALHLARLGGGCVIGVHAAGADGGGGGGSAGHGDGWPDTAVGHPGRHARRRAPAADAAAPGADALAYVARRAREADVPCDTVLAAAGPAHDAIIRTARDHMCDLIVMTMRGRHGIAGRLLAGTTQRVLAHSAIPVLVVRAP